MNTQHAPRIKTVEELTAEESERLRLLREADKSPRRIKDMHIGRVILICVLLGVFISIPASLNNDGSVAILILLFSGVFLICFAAFLTVFLLGSRSSRY